MYHLTVWALNTCRNILTNFSYFEHFIEGGYLMFCVEFNTSSHPRQVFDTNHDDGCLGKMSFRLTGVQYGLVFKRKTLIISYGTYFIQSIMLDFTYRNSMVYFFLIFEIWSRSRTRPSWRRSKMARPRRSGLWWNFATRSLLRSLSPSSTPPPSTSSGYQPTTRSATATSSSSPSSPKYRVRDP